MFRNHSDFIFFLESVVVSVVSWLKQRMMISKHTGTNIQFSHLRSSPDPADAGLRSVASVLSLTVTLLVFRLLNSLIIIIYLLQLLLGLPKFSQVKGGNLLRILNLLLVSPGLVLQLLNQLIQPLEVLLLLLSGELELLNFPVCSEGSLMGLRRPESLQLRTQTSNEVK